jgi:glutamyl-tRNA synthetase
MHITHVVRGCEYLTSTPKYNLLYEAFGWEVPVYVHLPLIMGRNADGTTSKLSKRHGSTGFADLIKEGYLPETIVNYIALLGWAPKDNCEIYSLQELCNAFSLDGISKSPAVFDYEKLTWMNGEYIHKMPKEEFIREATPYFKEVFGENLPDTEILADILQPRVLKFTEVPQMLQFFKELQDYPTDFFINKKSKATLENAPVMLQKSIDLLSSLEDWSVPSLHDKLLQLAKDLEVKNGTLLWPVRIAAAGQTVTPGGAMEILSILGKKESLRRLTLGLEKLKA